MYGLCLLLMTDVSELKDLVNTAEQSQFPDCDLFQQLKAAVVEAERCASVALQLVSRKHRTRYSCKHTIMLHVICYFELDHSFSFKLNDWQSAKQCD